MATARRRTEDGASLVEMALALPVLLLVVVAGMALSWLTFVQVLSGAAAREGVRTATLATPPLYRTRPDANAVAAAVADRVPVLGLRAADITVSYAGCASPCTKPPANGPVTVTIHKTLPAPFRPFVGIFAPGGTVVASSTGEARSE